MALIATNSGLSMGFDGAGGFRVVKKFFTDGDPDGGDPAKAAEFDYTMPAQEFSWLAGLLAAATIPVALTWRHGLAFRQTGEAPFSVHVLNLSWGTEDVGAVIPWDEGPPEVLTDVALAAADWAAFLVTLGTLPDPVNTPGDFTPFSL